MTAPGRPAVYIPSISGGERLRRCVEALSNQTMATEVVIADNGLVKSERDGLEKEFPEATIISFGENLGFGRALNRAIRTVGSGPVILVNDDAIARPNFVEEMVKASSRAPMVAGVLTCAEAPDLIDSAGVIIDQALMAFDYLSGNQVDALEGNVAPPLGPTGAAALYDRDFFSAVGGFDERIFLYYEDVDLALRMKMAGGTCVLAPEARAEHQFSATLGATSGRKHRVTGWSRGYMLRRYQVIRGPSSLAEVLLRDIPVCLGQLLMRRTTAGITGRLRGYRAAAGLDPRSLPPGCAIEMSAWAALKLRLGRAG